MQLRQKYQRERLLHDALANVFPAIHPYPFQYNGFLA